MFGKPAFCEQSPRQIETPNQAISPADLQEEAETASRSGMTESKSSGLLEKEGTNAIAAEPVDHRILQTLWNPAT